MKCAKCGGDLRETVLEHYERWPKDVGLIVFTNVPARECVECGEAYFDAGTSRKMEEIIAGAKEPEERMSVPVYSIK